MLEKNTKKRAVIVTTRTRDLYYGEVSASDAEVIQTMAVRVARCRHIAYWKGPVGGITGLATDGPGPGSRIGGACPSSLVTNVANLHDVTEAARSKFDALAPYGG